MIGDTKIVRKGHERSFTVHYLFNAKHKASKNYRSVFLNKNSKIVRTKKLLNPQWWKVLIQGHCNENDCFGYVS
jgi:hypothetical protein